MYVHDAKRFVRKVVFLFRATCHVCAMDRARGLTLIYQTALSGKCWDAETGVNTATVETPKQVLRHC